MLVEMLVRMSGTEQRGDRPSSYLLPGRGRQKRVTQEEALLVRMDADGKRCLSSKETEQVGGGSEKAH